MSIISQKSYIEIEYSDSPTSIKIIPSGWRNRFHVILEDPEEGDLFYDHALLTREQVERNYHCNLSVYFE